jgi:predicted transglutaminase-like cysteine proteinase
MSGGIKDRSAVAAIVLLVLLGCPTASVAHNRQLLTTHTRPMSIARSAPFMTVGESVLPPSGWIEFCYTYKAICETVPSAARDLVLSKSAWSDLNRINLWVNNNIRPMTDMAHYGKIQWWRYPDDGAGSCHSFALLKRRLVIQAGWPHEALLMTVVYDQEGKGHAILTVKTDKGDFILDNLRSDIRLWSRTGYQFLMRQSQSDPNRWVSVVGRPAGAAIAAWSPRQSGPSREPGRSLLAQPEAPARVSVPPLTRDWQAPSARQNTDLVLIDAIDTPNDQAVTSSNLVTPADSQTGDRPPGSPQSVAVRGGWGVQLIGDTSEISALKTYDKLQKQYDTLLGSRRPRVIRSHVGTNASWYRVRVAADNRDDAERLCNGVRAVGGSCIVQPD